MDTTAGDDDAANKRSATVDAENEPEPKRARTTGDENENPDAAVAPVVAATSSEQNIAPAAAAAPEEEEDDAMSVESSSLSYEWEGPGVRQPDGTFSYQAIRLHLPGEEQEFLVRRGDAVRLWSDDHDENNEKNAHDPAGGWICRVESLVSTKEEADPANNAAATDDDGDDDSGALPAEGEPRFRGRWFYLVPELQDMMRKSSQARERQDLKSLLDRLDPRKDVVLSNLQEDNDISTIQRMCHISYTNSGTLSANTSVAAATDLPSSITENDKFVCRFRLDWEKSSFSIREMDGSGGAGGAGGANRSASETNDNGTGMDDDDDDSLSVEARFNHVINEGEGSTLRGDIEVGDRYQCFVGPFVPNQTVPSRNPQLVWKPGCIEQSQYDQFTADLANLHSKYLRTHNLTVDEPYTPLRSERAEQLMKKLRGGGAEKRLTGSSLSSASMLSSGEEKRAELLKECDVDSVLRLLAEHKFNPQDTLAAIGDDPDQISAAWSSTEREIFDDCYRRHHGALRMVAKVLAPTKSMKQVVDYFYRFKIPDQFRVYQNKKREQAIHLIECIEKRRNPNAPIAASVAAADNSEDQQDSATNDGDTNSVTNSNKPWTEATVEDSTVQALEERRQRAKQLLLDVDSSMGSEVLTKIAVGIERLHSSFDRTTKEDLLRELNSQPHLQRRLLEFLPRDYY